MLTRKPLGNLVWFGSVLVGELFSFNLQTIYGAQAGCGLWGCGVECSPTDDAVLSLIPGSVTFFLNVTLFSLQIANLYKLLTKHKSFST